MDQHRSPSTGNSTANDGGHPSSSRLSGALITLVIVELTIATGNIHLTLGGPLFTLNGFGYLTLAGAYLIGAAPPTPIVQRFSWLPRIALAGYALVTIGAYLLTGTYFALGWITKGIEVAIVGLVVVDLLRTFGDPDGLRTAIVRSLTQRAGGGPHHA
jgi:hypothetical protein